MIDIVQDFYRTQSSLKFQRKLALASTQAIFRNNKIKNTSLNTIAQLSYLRSRSPQSSNKMLREFSSSKNPQQNSIIIKQSPLKIKTNNSKIIGFQKEFKLVRETKQSRELVENQNFFKVIPIRHRSIPALSLNLQEPPKLNRSKSINIRKIKLNAYRFPYEKQQVGIETCPVFDEEAEYLKSSSRLIE